MAERLPVLYPVGTAVAILLADGRWHVGVVVRHQQPAVWVKTGDGREWFVTNRRRIRIRNEA